MSSRAIAIKPNPNLLNGKAINIFSSPVSYHQTGNLTDKLITLEPSRGTPGFGKTVTYTSDNSYKASDEHFFRLTNVVNPTTGNFTEHLGLSLIKTLKIVYGSKTIMEAIPYEIFIRDILDTMPVTLRDRLITLTTLTSGEVIVPIYTPWSNNLNPGVHHPIPTGSLKKKLYFEVTFRSLSELLASGASDSGDADLGTVEYYQHVYDTDLDIDPNYSVHALKYVIGPETSFAAGVENTQMLSFLNDHTIKALTFNASTDANIAANLYLRQADFSRVKLKIDTDMHTDYDSSILTQWVQYITREQNEPLTNSSSIPMISIAPYDAKNSIGLLTIKSGRPVTAYGTAVAASTGYVVGLSDALFVIYNDGNDMDMMAYS